MLQTNVTSQQIIASVYNGSLLKPEPPKLVHYKKPNFNPNPYPKLNPISITNPNSLTLSLTLTEPYQANVDTD